MILVECPLEINIERSVTVLRVPGFFIENDTVHVCSMKCVISLDFGTYQTYTYASSTGSGKTASPRIVSLARDFASRILKDRTLILAG